jgi:hypothetical protein
MAGQSIVWVKNRQTWTRSLNRCGQNLNLAVPSRGWFRTPIGADSKTSLSHTWIGKEDKVETNSQVPKHRLAVLSKVRGFRPLCHLTTYRPETQFPPKHDSRITTRNRELTSLRTTGYEAGDEV